MKNIVFTLIFCGFAVLSQGQVNRSVDGFGNNQNNPEWGSAGAVLAQWTGNGFHDSIGEPSGYFRPNPRLISNMIFRQDEVIFSDQNLTEYVWAFGQFIDHDISLVRQNPSDYLGIKIPSNDGFFAPGSYMPFFRSAVSKGTGFTSSNPRKYDNEVSSFIDGSMIYGSDTERANWLRSFENGKLKTSKGNLLPWNTVDQEFNSPHDPNAPNMDNDVGLVKKLFVAGDTRANEHPMLISLHTLFVREHNRICDSLVQIYPNWGDEILYQKARKYVGAYLQNITYNEWLPSLQIHIETDQTYNAEIDPNISNVFSAAAFRIGHSMIANEVVRYDLINDTIINQELLLKDAFFNPNLITLSGGIESFLLGISHSIQQKIDAKIVDGVRNFLFEGSAAAGLDLAAINIMRGRDRGLPDYTTVRKDLGMVDFNDFSDITEDEELIYQLRFLYGNVSNLDPWVGMLIEKPAEGAVMGQMLSNIIREQFENLMLGDRFFFEYDLSLTVQEKEEIRNTKLSDIITRNSGINHLRENVFIYHTEPETDEGPELIRKDLDAVVYPVPTEQFLNLKFFMEECRPVMVSVLDMFGHRIIEDHIIASKGPNIHKMELSNDYPPGFYFLTLESGQNHRVFKIRMN